MGGSSLSTASLISGSTTRLAMMVRKLAAFWCIATSVTSFTRSRGPTMEATSRVFTPFSFISSRKGSAVTAPFTIFRSS